jgi:hypothetical protein
VTILIAKPEIFVKTFYDEEVRVLTRNITYKFEASGGRRFYMQEVVSRFEPTGGRRFYREEVGILRTVSPCLPNIFNAKKSVNFALFECFKK